MPSSQQKNFVAVTADAPGQKEVVEHTQIVEQQVFAFVQIDTDSPKVAVETYRADHFGEIEGGESADDPERVGLFQKFQQGGGIDMAEYIVECPEGDEQLEEIFEEPLLSPSACLRFQRSPL